MKNRFKKIVPALFVFSLLAAPVFAVTDYSSMSTEELAQLRGTMRDAPAEEWEAFHHEWQKRFQTMTREEQMKYSGPPENAPRDGSGPGYGRGGGMGSGGGGGMGGKR